MRRLRARQSQACDRLLLKGTYSDTKPEHVASGYFLKISTLVIFLSPFD